MNSESFDVVVVGAGPTGLLLASELVLGGASVVVLERLTAMDETIKAGGIGALAGEALERRGLGPALDAEEQAMVEAMAAMVKVSGSQVNPLANGWRKMGGHFAGLFLIDQTRQREPERRLRGVRQQGLERILGEFARSLGVEMRRGHEFVGFKDDGEGVSVEARSSEGTRTLRCAYLVGCDGGRSLVRKQAGFDFPGTEPTLTGHQAIVELDHPERLLPLGWRRTAAGMFAYGPTPGRIFVAEFDGPPSDRSAPITVDEVERSLRRVSGADVRITGMKTATRFTDNARQATSYRRGRVLLVGDAAHVHSPFGGQGLNLGLLDAMNLGWKLAATVRRWAPEGLLDTYTSERHPVAARVLEITRAQVALMRPDAQTTALREIVARLMDLDEGNRFFGEMMSGITTRYELGDTHPLVGRLCADRAVVLEDGETRLYSLMHRGAGVLLDAGGGAAVSVAKAWEPRIRALRVRGETSMLLRPDGCIAWATDAGDTAGLEPALHRWFGSPTV
ncbi:FAD-dependent monooxygenase [Vitiosangium sp. GDMCC 1.1324]|uniref:FAD-dependent monooxygenase n=1 Tax=Vitiosangium sp. (strain GDMCC 1.1324) TaxID=2138576 RepID=UPI000D3C2970|nr:FAD-dependent monooxygenase [Vitiosangium sp. GDMCC 1.1324]PTL77743.1 FAD-binding monooxygenase [Vitiosangium sp. GDMCC 1.1324]